MAAVASFSSHLILRRFIFHRPTQLCAVARKSFTPLQTTPYFTSTRFIHHSPASPCAVSQPLAGDIALLEISETESEAESNALGSSSAVPEDLKKSNLGIIKSPPPPSLSVKEKKELASYAHSLGKKLKSQQVGKSGITDTVVMALIETLEANELLKLKIHGTCPGELEDVVKQLEETTGSVAVGQIGRTVILYRPSITKLKAEEKKKQAQRVYLKRQLVSKQYKLKLQSERPASVSGEEARQFGRGRRGRSRIGGP